MPFSNLTSPTLDWQRNAPSACGRLPDGLQISPSCHRRPPYDVCLHYMPLSARLPSWHGPVNNPSQGRNPCILHYSRIDPLKGQHTVSKPWTSTEQVESLQPQPVKVKAQTDDQSHCIARIAVCYSAGGSNCLHPRAGRLAWDHRRFRCKVLPLAARMGPITALK